MAGGASEFDRGYVEEYRMTRLARISFGLLLCAVTIAAPFSARARRALPSAVGRPVHPAEAGSPSADPTAGLRWYLADPHPCVRDSDVLVVAAFDATPCDSFAGTFMRDPRYVVYHTVVHDSVPCRAVMPHVRPIRHNLGLF